MSDSTQAIDDILTALAVAAVFLNNLSAAAGAIRQQQAEGREPTQEEVALQQKVTDQKRALAAAS